MTSAELQDAELGRVNFEGAILVGADLQGLFLGRANLQRADLRGANLQKSHLKEARLRSASLREAHLQGATLLRADLREANLRRANLQGVTLAEANLQEADLREANFREAILINADITNARLSYVDLTRATYAPASLPRNNYVAGIQGLSSVVIPTPGDFIGLVQLRKLLQEAGLPEEREATYAIERNKTYHLFFQAVQDWTADHADWVWFPRNDPRALVEGYFRRLAFELPVDYGLYPGRALRMLLGGIGCFGLVYTIALVTETGTIYRVWPAGRLEPLTSDTGLAEKAKAEPLFLWRSWWALPWGLWFSTLSAFHLGFRELNVGNWLARVQPREYGLQADGWVRVFAGLQSLLSVYLLAMWVLTYFGRPFG
jgi:hypothetical protein